MIELISLLGYQNGSPFFENPYLDISTPEGLIDMSNTPIDLIGIDNKGNKKRMKAGRRKPYKFQGDTVREFPVRQFGGYSPEDLYNFLFEEDEVSPVAPIIEEEEQQDNSQELRLRDNRIKRLEAENQAMAMFIDDEEEIYNNPYSNIPAPMTGPITNSRANNSLVPVPTPKGVKEKEDYAFNFFVNKGYTPQIAAGIVANIRHESNFNPATVGDGGKAKGIAQWHPDRYSKLAKSFDLTTLDGGLAAIDHELKSSEAGSFKKISKAQTAEEAAALVDQHYERSAGLSRGKRVSSARDIYSRFAKYEKGGTYQIPHEELAEMKKAGYKFSIIP